MKKGGGKPGGVAKKSGNKVTQREAAVRDAFEQFMRSHYGQRWNTLRSSLMRPTRYVCVVNRFVATKEQTLAVPQGLAVPAWLAPRRGVVCFESTMADVEKPFEPPTTDVSTGLKSHYILDGASVLCAAALAPQDGQSILDMCAAPGGKSFVLSQFCSPSLLQCNEVDPSRRRRLASVIAEYIPSSNVRFEVSGLDASKRGAFGFEEFDRVLLDAPCSAERHLMQNDKELVTAWKRTRASNHAKKQVAILHEGRLWLLLFFFFFVFC
jgi:5-methylcytosine rRNA methyltransferase NSUN4